MIIPDDENRPESGAGEPEAPPKPAPASRAPVPQPDPPPPPPPKLNKKQAALLDTLQKVYRIPGPRKGLPPLQAGVFLFLQEGGSQEGSLEALEHLQADTVDWNEVRVSSMSEYLSWCAPAGGDDLEMRCERVMLFLSNVYRDHNDVTLDALLDMTREDRLKYLLTVEPLEPWMIHYMLNSMEDFKPFLFQNDMSRVLQRLGLIGRQSSPRKATEAAYKVFGGHKLTLSYQCALVRLGTETCVSAIRVNLCRGCVFSKKCPSSKA